MHIIVTPWLPLIVRWVFTMFLTGCALGAHHGDGWVRIRATPWWPFGLHWVLIMMLIGCMEGLHYGGYQMHVGWPL